ncbi:MAG: hypothetical protein PVI39_12925, partial [Desulfobacteraceae bacterium]
RSISSALDSIFLFAEMRARTTKNSGDWATRIVSCQADWLGPDLGEVCLSLSSAARDAKAGFSISDRRRHKTHL